MVKLKWRRIRTNAHRFLSRVSKSNESDDCATLEYEVSKMRRRSSYLLSVRIFRISTRSTPLMTRISSDIDNLIHFVNWHASPDCGLYHNKVSDRTAGQWRKLRKMRTQLWIYSSLINYSKAILLAFWLAGAEPILPWLLSIDRWWTEHGSPRNQWIKSGIPKDFSDKAFTVGLRSVGMKVLETYPVTLLWSCNRTSEMGADDSRRRWR